MQAQFDSWQKASHHTSATCVDCHLPRNFIERYIAKAENGWGHSKAFTLQNFHEPIMIAEKSSRILQENCIACHQNVLHDSLSINTSSINNVSCTHCHKSVGHGETVGLGKMGETNHE